jgi:hypothetical protein
MPNELNRPNKLAYSTHNLPGSVAEQKEAQRLEEFQRAKAIERAEELRNQPVLAAKRQEAYDAACAANQERMRLSRAANSAQRNYRKP